VVLKPVSTPKAAQKAQKPKAEKAADSAPKKGASSVAKKTSDHAKSADKKALKSKEAHPKQG
jgi:hypothetical protein